MDEKPKIMKELAKFLKDRGHMCVHIVGMNKYSFEWCQQDDCPATKSWKDMQKRQMNTEEFQEVLEARGHKCIVVMESYPVQIGWCKQEPCKFLDPKTKNKTKK
jgi:hypothetical protein